MTETRKKAPEFVVYVGPMWSGKSSALLGAIDRFRLQGRSVAAFKPQMDERYSTQSEIVTHTGWKIPASSVTCGADVLRELEALPGSTDVVAVDELFMIPDVAEALVWLYRNGATVIASTLELSATGKPFAEVTKILPWATRVEKCAAVCAVCREDAAYTWKKVTSDEEIEVGGADKYEPRCWHCHAIVNMVLADEAGCCS